LVAALEVDSVVVRVVVVTAAAWVAEAADWAVAAAMVGLVASRATETQAEVVAVKPVAKALREAEAGSLLGPREPRTA